MIPDRRLHDAVTFRFRDLQPSRQGARQSASGKFLTASGSGIYHWEESAVAPVAGWRLRSRRVVNVALRFPTRRPDRAHRGWKVRRERMQGVGIV
jgi:hypothetical protein